MYIKQTIEFIDNELSQTLIDYQAWFAVRPDLLVFKPRVGWSVEQILEHVTLTNHFLLILIRKGKRKAIELSSKKDLKALLESYTYNLDELEAIAEHKSFSWLRPEHMEPKGDKELGQIRVLLDDQINECIEILYEIRNGEGILYKTTMTVNNLGKIDVYQYIYFLCQHAKRHIVQMQKVKEEFSNFKEDE
ncbi:DinB family protein [Paenibacillus sp. N3/727]|uniref:DinB family protein n=1 Tax=Paenibacillus sp. N3/727 TaxID=2925845 RepID=UPI001F53BC35|nr:DinB family protein [Paenibacillus sp. N3/727]UNK17019.1 DinB family protein [Paenibacillus sp. N3/727]